MNSAILTRALANVDDAIEATIAEVAETDSAEVIAALGERLHQLDLLASFLAARFGRDPIL